MIFDIGKPGQKQPDYVFRPEYQEKLKEYSQHRISQLQTYLRPLEFWGVDDVLDHYFKGFNAIIAEIDLMTNDPETKRKNVTYLLSSNGCSDLFWEDVWAIIHGQEPYLPDNILEIPAFKQELRRQEEAEKARVKKLADDIAGAEMQKRHAVTEAERQKIRRIHLAQELGLEVEVLEKLQKARE